MPLTAIARALNIGLRKALETNPKVVLMGEDIGTLGGVFRVTDGLQKEFGDQRVMDTPLAESGIVGTAIGLAMRGYRPVCEIQFDGFVFPAFDQIVNQLAKLHYRSGGRVTMPVVIRIPFGGGIGAVEHHSESPEGLFAHVAGLKVISCSNAADAYTMIQQAIRSDDPVVFFEPKRRYWEKCDVDLDAPLSDSVPLHAARVVRPGRDLTLLAYGPSVKTAVDAATAAADEGHEIEVVDVRSLTPIDWETICDSVRRTGRCVTVHEAQVFMGLGAELAAHITEKCFFSLQAPVLRVGGFAVTYPPSRMEENFLPDLDRILDTVDRSLAY